MKILFFTTIILIALFFATVGYAQDAIRIAVTHDFKKERLVQTFSFDLNRTEKIDEKTTGRFLLYTAGSFYILPASDVNIGEGVTASENNVMFQANIGKQFLGIVKTSADNLTTRV